MEITGVECHGTGTLLGDPIEVGALSACLKCDCTSTVTGMSAAKTQIGHLEGGSGIAGLCACVTTLRLRVVPQNVHFRILNPHLQFGSSSLRIPYEVTAL